MRSVLCFAGVAGSSTTGSGPRQPVEISAGVLPWTTTAVGSKQERPGLVQGRMKRSAERAVFFKSFSFDPWPI